MEYRYIKPEHESPYLEVNVTDYALISNPLLNKGMAFTKEEREAFGLLGLLPPHVFDLEHQRSRSYFAFKNKSSDLERYLYLQDLQNSNETLYYSLLTKHIDEMLPIVYTPTVGLSCQQFSRIYRRPRGIYISYPYQQHIRKILANPRFDRVKVIVVTDGERILGLGDQGAGGMGIPIGKLALYTACAGVHPIYTLPILLDVGTNNQALLTDPLYIGWRHERIRGQAYDDFIDQFVQAVKQRFPHVLLQWEDFAQLNANPILARYRQSLCTFNDDIQSTAAAAAGTLFAALASKQETLAMQKIVIVGAGSAGCGIADCLRRAMLQEGLTAEQIQARIFMVDRQGLLLTDMSELQTFQTSFAQPRTCIANWQLTNPNYISLLDTLKNTHATVLIGVAGQPNIFTEAIVRLMANYVKRPIIFPLSNPPSHCEANPADLLAWTQGQVIVSTGSPFPAVNFNGDTRHIDQTNNGYIFPGMGLALIATKARIVTDEMFMAAAKALADLSPAKQNSHANLLPAFTYIRDVSLHIATKVAEEILRAGLAQKMPNQPLEQYLRDYMWEPAYLPYRYKK